MADTQGSPVADSQMQQELLQAAQSQVAQAMANAVGNVSGDKHQEGPSEFLKQHLSVEVVQPVEEPAYVEPMQDPYNKAIKYLENHNILQLFQHLTARIVYNRPEKPLEFMVAEVERMKLQKKEQMDLENL